MENPEDFILSELGERIKLKKPSIGPPTKYLGKKVTQVTLDNSALCCVLGL